LEDGSAVIRFGRGPAMATSSQTRRLDRLMQLEGVAAIRWCRQVHGSDLATVATGDPPRPLCVGESDGLLTAATGVGLVVWTADCVPVVLVSDRAVAAVHAGWRGCAAGIASAAVSRLQSVGATAPDEVRAYLGPAISAAHYQVGPEVIEALAATGVPSSAWLDGDRVDLRSFLSSQLARLGVERVSTIGGCTFADPTLASYRRDGDRAGRQWSLVSRRDV
jgi:YfiH family protein